MPQKRLLSLDAFRGATIALMVLVNDPGGFVTYRQLQHARWNGWTITDMVFPFFLWIVGVAMTFSIAAMAYVLLCFAVAWILWKRRWFFKV